MGLPAPHLQCPMLIVEIITKDCGFFASMCVWALLRPTAWGTPTEALYLRRITAGHAPARGPFAVGFYRHELPPFPLRGLLLECMHPHFNLISYDTILPPRVRRGWMNHPVSPRCRPFRYVLRVSSNNCEGSSFVVCLHLSGELFAPQHVTRFRVSGLVLQTGRGRFTSARPESMLTASSFQGLTPRSLGRRKTPWRAGER